MTLEQLPRTDHDYLVAMYSEMRIQTTLVLAEQRMHTKLLYATIAAILGSKFIPSSRVDWIGASTFALRFLMFLVGFFVLEMLWELHKLKQPISHGLCGLILFMLAGIVISIFLEYGDSYLKWALNVVRAGAIVSLYLIATELIRDKVVQAMKDQALKEVGLSA